MCALKLYSVCTELCLQENKQVESVFARVQTTAERFRMSSSRAGRPWTKGKGNGGGRPLTRGRQRGYYSEIVGSEAVHRLGVSEGVRS